MQSAHQRRTIRQRLSLAGATLLLLALYASTAFPAAALQPGNQHFQRTWERTDRPVLDGITARTWMWGPEAFTDILAEPYAEAPGGERSVQYFDKARMEITNPNGDPNSIWYVTNGLLVVELITGNMQLGDDTFEQRTPALVNVAGDADDPTGPTYASFQTLLDDPAQPLGATITARVDRSGNVSSDPSLAAQNVTVGYIDEVTNHAIAGPFWEFMNSDGAVYQAGQFVTNPLFESPFFATGRPITEAYWAEVKVGGQYRDVLMQCFERRCLTYTPGNPDGFIVEAGNVGQHYYAWRYAEQPDEEEHEPTPAATEPSPTPTATEPSPTPTSTAPMPTETAEPSPTPTETPSPTPEPATKYEYVNQWGGRGDEDTTFSDPTDIAVAPNGNVYVVDKLDRVQVFDPDGVWIKSWGTEGSGPGQFKDPEGIAVDADGYVYVADTANERIQKFDPDGVLIDDWPLGGFPSDIAIDDDQGLAFITDMSNHKVHVYHLDGKNNRSWGEFGGNAGQLFIPGGVTVGPDGNIYVADTGNNRVQVFTWDGNFLGLFGSKGDGEGEFKSPNDVTVAPAGPTAFGVSVYVSDSANHRIQIFSQQQVAAPASERALAATIRFIYSAEFGSRGSEDGQFILPDGLTQDDSGNLYVADYRNDRIQKFGRSFTGGIRHLDSWYDGTRGHFKVPGELVYGPDGRLYLADSEFQQIQIFGPDGGFVDQWRDIPAAGMTFDSQGVLYLTNSEEHRVEQYDQNGAYLGAWEPGGSLFFRQGALAIDDEDNIYVLHGLAASIQKYRHDGTYVTAWGAPGSQPGQFKIPPSDIAVYGDAVYVVDRMNNRIQQFDLDGRFVRLWGEKGSGEGQFDVPTGIAIDADGYIFVADTGNNRIQKFTPDGQYLAQWGSAGSGDGQFQGPAGIAVDPDGNVYVVDTGNYRIEVFQPVN